MKIKKSHLKKSLFAFLFFGVFACDPCNDCDFILFEPNVKAVFINQTQIEFLEDNIEVFERNDSSLQVANNSLNFLQNRAEEIQDSIDNGLTPSIDLAQIEQLIAVQRQDSTFFAELNQDADSLTTLFNQEINAINNGLLNVDTIRVTRSGFDITTMDSSELWNLPLNFEGTSEEFIISIFGKEKSDTVAFGYRIVQTVDERNTVLPRAVDIVLMEGHTYDRVDVCEENCIDGSATYTFYF
ncbi:MAG: hypothetical protein AAF789_02805 [Bacteroidota bacterium]